MMRALTFAALLLASTCAQAQWGGRPIDVGGDVGDRIRALGALNGRRHEIRGDCMSACTIMLGATNVCVHRDAVLWFHSASAPDGNAAMLDKYPPRVRAFVIRNGLSSSSTLRGVSARQLISLGIPPCR